MLKKENEAIKDKIIRDIKNLFKEEEEDFYKEVRVGNFYSNKYTKYESNGDRSKTLSTEKYLNKTRPHLRDITKSFKNLINQKFS